ncbi:hypothetical protein GCM10011507_35000 [Edaphobacter acidisoli]|uniref:Uncharacterized protein n=1 Tax=Edaphobacter acidisoli TaxID=2040573 RepID=A0A916W9U3_9BACT|nr:hypothetical protein [Edaphobacter acidisoli]GGA80788.1 hypothetical protein GCM10011507_35000 [Edaphobacter acidisoli]
MAGRPRKANAIHEITGAKAKNPQRFHDREEPETAGPIGDPPADFLSEHGSGPKLLALWNKLVAEAPIGLLTASDSEYLAAVCRMGLEASRVGSKGYRQALKEYGLMLKGLGMTPEGRAIRGIGGKAPKKTVNPLDEFTRARQRAG